MTSTGETSSGGRGRTVALAMTWDGARWPAAKLPPKVRAFLAGKSRKAAVASVGDLAKLFATDRVDEIRVCWMPCLKGGDNVLSEPFPTPSGTRIAFKPARITRFGDILGVVYRRNVLQSPERKRMVLT